MSKSSKNKIIVLGVVVILLVVLLIGGSYAWISLQSGGNNTTVVKAGKISMTLDESLSEGISIPNAYPMTDSEGKEQSTLYKFSVENDGNTNNTYQIYLVDSEISEGSKRMSDGIIKYRLQKDGDFDKIDYISNLASKEGETNAKVLDSGTLKVGEKVTYTIQVWIDYNADNSIQKQAFAKKLQIDATQIVE